MSDLFPPNSLLQLFETHYRELRGALRRWTQCDALADDIAQETWLRLREHPLQVETENPRGYLFRLVRNLAIDRLRQRTARERRTVVLLDEHSEPEQDPVRRADATERLERLTAAIGELPPRCREVFLLHKVGGLSHAEISQRLGISRSMVEKHVMKALAHLRDRLEETESRPT